MIKIQHIILTIMVALLSTVASWAIDTTDRIAFHEVTLTPGETGR